MDDRWTDRWTDPNYREVLLSKVKGAQQFELRATGLTKGTRSICNDYEPI